MTQKKLVKVNALAYAHLIKALQEGDHTVRELSEITGLAELTVYWYCRELHRVKAVHIATFAEDARGYRTATVYKMGPGKDAKRVRYSQAERTARYRDKIKARELVMVMGGQGQYVKSANGGLRFETLGSVT
jgi:hypothetical protein